MRAVTSMLATALALALAGAGAVDARGLRAQPLTFGSLVQLKFTRGVNKDAACSYSFKTLACEPANVCSYQYKFGDLTPSQSCRIDTAVDGATPRQIHLAYAGAEPGTAMTISWTTFTRVSDPAVWLGAPSGALELADAPVDVATYYADDKYALFNYHATVTGLSPHSTYAFQVGSKGAAAAERSDVSSFTTARATSDKSDFAVAIYGDLGVGEYAEPTYAYLDAKLPGKVDFVFHVGDISYADNAGLLTASEALGFFYEETYNNFMNLISPLTTRVPYMVSVGNHEAECHSARCLLSSSKKDQLGNYTAYNTRFKMPSAESGGVLNMWYSFDHGPVHFTSISSETDYPDAPKNSFFGRAYGGFGDQLAWLEADLKKADANRAHTPWLIVTMHRAMYTRTLCDADGMATGEAAPVQKAFEDLFLKYNVDVVVGAHYHMYERQLPIQHGAPVLDGVSSDRKTYSNPQAPVYVVTGAAGNNEGHEKIDAARTAPWSVVIENQHFGISKLHVSRKALRWQFIAVATDDVLDDFVVTKG